MDKKNHGGRSKKKTYEEREEKSVISDPRIINAGKRGLGREGIDGNRKVRPKKPHRPSIHFREGNGHKGKCKRRGGEEGVAGRGGKSVDAVLLGRKEHLLGHARRGERTLARRSAEVIKSSGGKRVQPRNKGEETR